LKRSINIGGHKTSISLEDEFWNCLKEIAGERGIGLGAMIEGIDGGRKHANVSGGSLCFRRSARRHAGLAHLYCAFGAPLCWRRYYQILGPRRHLPKFSNGVCGYSEILVRLNSHLIWQAAKSDVESGSAFGLVSHKGLPYC
jgi:hypothetical protein